MVPSERESFLFDCVVIYKVSDSGKSAASGNKGKANSEHVKKVRSVMDFVLGSDTKTRLVLGVIKIKERSGLEYEWACENQLLKIHHSYVRLVVCMQSLREIFT